ncbi:MAG: (Fe-S)-binding protein [Thermodesulfobacteriota bacterium]|nr:(Fe-S)-binding protein [Thermodesulfobacteriota bacterium]
MNASSTISGLSRLAKIARELEDLTSVCKKCGICQSVCPLFPLTGMERDIARGKVAVLEGVMADVVKNANVVLERFNRCLLCGACAGVCPNGVDTMAIFLRARALLTEYKGLSPTKKLLFRQVLARPRLFDRMAAMAACMQPLFLKKDRENAETRTPRLTASPLLHDRHVIPLADTPFHAATQGNDRSVSHDGPAVLFFTGCLIDKFFPNIATASVGAMHLHGFLPVVPHNQGCCGIPALSSGDMPTFRRLVHHHIQLFNDLRFDRVVTACATCAFTIKKLWPAMIEEDDPLADAIKAVAAKTTDITTLISEAGMPEASANADARTVTYHDPCHLKKSLGIDTAPRRLIRAAPEYRLVEMAEADKCCGMGGGFGIQFNDLSTSMGMEKQRHIMETGCSVVATGCPACMIQIAGMLAAAGHVNIAVRHPIELYMTAS